MSTESLPTPETADIHGLLEQRARLQEWLERLDAVAGDADPRIAERVRGDYQARLRQVLDELAAHLDALRQEREDRRQALADAELRHRQAADALEEARLRHRIGELGDEEWEQRQAELEEAVGAGASERDGARAEAERLEAIVSQIEAGVAQEGAAEDEAPVEPAPVLLELSAADILAAGDEQTMEYPPLPPLEAAAEGEERDFAFLEELDRAIEASPGSPSAAGTGAATADEGAPRARPGAKCPECGYTNDAEAWYCGVCGIDLA